MKIKKPLKASELAPPTTLSQEKQEFAAIFMLAYSDVETCIKRVNEDHTDFWKRSLFRSFFSLVEFTSFRLRYLLLAGFKDGSLTLSPEEILTLQEQTPELNGSGGIRLKNKFFAFEDYLKFTLKTYAKHFEIAELDNFSDGGWDAMRRSVVIRNLLTHPRTIAHLFISENELGDLNTAMNWYFKIIKQLIK